MEENFFVLPLNGHYQAVIADRKGQKKTIKLASIYGNK